MFAAVVSFNCAGWHDVYSLCCCKLFYGCFCTQTQPGAPAIRSTDTVFLDGQSWGFGGGVDVALLHPWNVTGRYGWVGGTGTSAYVVPSDNSVAVLLTQVELGGPTGSAVIEAFLTAAAEQLDRHGA